jgi:hypothetical protein
MTRFQRKKHKRSLRVNGGLQWLGSVYSYQPFGYGLFGGFAGLC